MNGSKRHEMSSLSKRQSNAPSKRVIRFGFYKTRWGKRGRFRCNMCRGTFCRNEMNLVRFCRKNRYAIYLLTLFLIGAGLVSVFRLPSNIYPELNFPRIMILAHSGDLDPEAMMLSVTRPIEVKLFGPGMDVLEKAADEIGEKIQKIPDIVDFLGIQKGNPEISFQVDPLLAGRVGMTVEQVSEQVRAGLLGLTETSLRQADRTIDIRVRFAEHYIFNRKTCRRLEVWKDNRQARQVQRGYTLRIQCSAPFRLHWTADQWRMITDTSSTATALGIHYVDIPVQLDQQAPIQFTFFWTALGQWEGRDYMVEVVPGPPSRSGHTPKLEHLGPPHHSHPSRSGLEYSHRVKNTARGGRRKIRTNRLNFTKLSSEIGDDPSLDGPPWITVTELSQNGIFWHD